MRLSSLGFIFAIVPLATGGPRSVLMAVLCTMLMCTSVWYHGNHSEVARFFDVNAARVTGTTAVFLGAAAMCNTLVQVFGQTPLQRARLCQMNPRAVQPRPVSAKRHSVLGLTGQWGPFYSIAVLLQQYQLGFDLYGTVLFLLALGAPAIDQAHCFRLKEDPPVLGLRAHLCMHFHSILLLSLLSLYLVEIR